MADKTKKPAKKPIKRPSRIVNETIRISPRTGKPVEPRNYTVKTGRPTKYRPEYCQAIIDFFSVPSVDAEGKALPPPYFLDFCLSIDIATNTMMEWVTAHPNFSIAYSIAKEKQKQIMISHALVGGYNPSFAWRAMMNMHNWRDKTENENTNKIDESTMKLAMQIYRGHTKTTETPQKRDTE